MARKSTHQITKDPGAGDGSPQKLASVVASKIEADIIREGWPVGEVLGSESDLIERYEVSRAVLREAVRLLEHKQIAAMRRGPGGGLVVNAPAPSAVAETVAVFFEFTDISLAELYEARQALELVAIRLATQRLTEDGIGQLRQTLVNELAREPRPGFDLHRAIADVSGNPAVSVFVNALLRGTRQMIPPTTLTPRTNEEVHGAHETVVDALVTGNIGRAEHALREHLQAATEWTLQAIDERSLRQAARRRALRRRGEVEERTKAHLKLPERLARQIKDQILEDEREPGEVIGSEAEFLERYDVSRAVFREAVRILEYYGIAQTRRGPGGGLVVKEPEGSRVIDAITTYLDFMRIDPVLLNEARRAVELTSVERAVERLTPEGEQRLIDLRQRDEALTTEDVGSAVHDLHIVISELALNRPLQLFTRVLIRLQSERSKAMERVDPEEARAVSSAHVKIVDALLDRDTGLARHRLGRHLEAITPYTSPIPVDALDAERAPRPRR